ncbi:Uncharacterised protein [Elizabethkingia miricola]|nr:Uncharacterised protein [Elizabethkingia miricola]
MFKEIGFSLINLLLYKINWSCFRFIDSCNIHNSCCWLSGPGYSTPFLNIEFTFQHTYRKFISSFFYFIYTYQSCFPGRIYTACQLCLALKFNKIPVSLINNNGHFRFLIHFDIHAYIHSLNPALGIQRICFYCFIQYYLILIYEFHNTVSFL